MKNENKNINDAIEKIEKIEKNAKEMSGEHTIPLPDLLIDEFMTKYTIFSSLDEMGKKSEGKIDPELKFKNNEEWNNFINETSEFEDWQSMVNKAAGEYAIKRIMG